MRIRYLKPDFFKDEDIKNLPFEVRLFYQGLWCYADKQGKMEDRPERLKVEIMPYDKIDTEKLLNELLKKPFINRYEVDGKRYIKIINWEKHQKPHHTEKDSIIPEPLNNPLKGIEKGMGKLKQLTATPLLDNGSVTVKDTLKTKHLDFVMLTTDEYAKLKDLFGDALKGKIENLNNYIGSTGKRYKSHYHTILNWASKDPVTTQDSEKPDPRLHKKSGCCTWSISKKDGKYICNKCEKVVVGFLD